MTSSERAHLRSIANGLEPIIHIGKEGITPALLKQADEALTARELIKGTVLKNCDYTAREALNMLCEQLGAEGIQAIGRRFTLYRKKPEEEI